MLELLQKKLESVFRNLRGYGKLSESNVADALREIRLALLAADVHYPVAKRLCEEIQKRALGREVLASIRPGDQFIKIFHDELVRLLGEGVREIRRERPLRILLCGLNGSGKTTTAAKLALWFRKQRQKVAMVAGDLTRPAAREQLERLGEQIQVPVYAWPEGTALETVVREGRARGERERVDVLIFDAAGRLDVDGVLLEELAAVAGIWEPGESLLVVDAATGQAAVRVAEAFAARVPITGLVLSRADGDARGGAALSIQQVTGIPIKFLGVGEKPDALQPFVPERFVGRLLGMGDIVALVDRVQSEIDAQSMEEVAKRLKSNEFTLQDFLAQLRLLKKMGPLESILGLLPGFPGKEAVKVDEKRIKRIEAIILSMTPEERRRPEILNGRRRLRIARGSGTQVSDVNDLLRKFDATRKMMRKLSKGEGRGWSKFGFPGARSG
ncbi:Signal Recognition Particle (SRP) component with 4.5S RNA (ffs) [Methylacidimicrobium sp. AP8]|uniref:signal recognition particle protein n=1 Tax=Methylacidimicrobium sp. AP8 TaxID=2730359 RepID=UPI0018C190F8|nr:signal recognition particle protein [Methylacidimicrobium sp. AP8]CAB4244160.1 Signal Recognition Particle (SRP) component with 4.5S RNA (ffs) [Methylacidimicrobium sp. AP8]